MAIDPLVEQNVFEEIGVFGRWADALEIVFDAGAFFQGADTGEHFFAERVDMVDGDDARYGGATDVMDFPGQGAELFTDLRLLLFERSRPLGVVVADI